MGVKQRLKLIDGLQTQIGLHNESAWADGDVGNWPSIADHMEAIAGIAPEVAGLAQKMAEEQPYQTPYFRGNPSGVSRRKLGLGLAAGGLVLLAAAWKL